MNVRTEIIAVEIHDTDLASFAMRLQGEIDAACLRVMELGGRILGAVATTPVSAWSNSVPEGTDREYRTVENGVIATITYEIE
jgi:hypothetical protein